MIEEREARKRILEAVAGIAGTETVAFGEALDRNAGSDVFGRIDLPGFDNSSMDGYAVRAEEAFEGAVLAVSGEQPAGEDRELVLDRGAAVRIFTGAPIPEGADAVIMQEDVELRGKEIRIVIGVESGENIRPRGNDVCEGQRILSKGERLTPARVALLASQGMTEVTVACRPRVGIVTTGDELVDGSGNRDGELKPGQIFNSNGPMLGALVRQFGGESRFYHARDESGELRSVLESALGESAFVLVAGGVSVGERDLVKSELAALGVESDFWRVRVKPGKPFLFGRRAGESPSFVFGLPGNPVSAFVTFLLFAAPALVRYLGEPGSESGGLPLPKIRRPLAEPLSNPGDRPHYVRVRLDPAGAFRPTGLQQSHAVFGLSRADALIRLEAETTFDAGVEVDGYLLG